MSDNIPPIPEEILALLNAVRPCSNDHHIVEYVGRDADTLEPVLIHRSSDDNYGVFFISKAEHFSNMWERPEIDGLQKTPDGVRGQIYRHYKGGRYMVIAVGYYVHDSSLAVIYKSVDKPQSPPWVRPYNTGLTAWMQPVIINDVCQARFEKL